jgi:hypothetical protein
MTEQETRITPYDIVKPLVSPEKAAEDWALFEALKSKLLTSEDYQPIAGKQYIKRSGFRKIAVYFGLSDRILEEEKVERDDGSFYWRIKTEVEAPNGRTCVGVGICDSRERNFAHVEHDVYSTSHTRAKSRAISDMVAGGVVSAEEVEAEGPRGSSPRKQVPSDSKAKPQEDTRQATNKQRQTIHKYGVKTIPKTLTLTEASKIIDSLFSMSKAKDSQGIKKMVNHLNAKWETGEEAPSKDQEKEPEPKAKVGHAPKTQEKLAEETAEEPKPDPAEETVVKTLLANGLRVAGYLEVTRQGDKVHVKPPQGIEQEGWNPYNAILGHMKAVWNPEALRWEVPVN